MIDGIGELKKGSELEVSEYGQYTSAKAFNQFGGECRYYHFECVGFHDGKAIIETNTGRLHKKGDDFIFMVLGNNKK